MIKRTITGILSGALLLIVLHFRGWFYALALVIVAGWGCYEMLGAFKHAGMRPPRLPVYAQAALMLPVYKIGGLGGLAMLLTCTCLWVMFEICLRREPTWQDAAASISTILFVPLPLSLMFAIVEIQPEMLGALLSLLIFVVALVGDMFAYFVGVAMGRTKLNPAISPKKTWEGSAAGLAGSVCGAIILYVVGSGRTAMPAWWHFVLLGLLGGVAGQLGDLSASLIKRHCGIKDFGSVFPGHGGMLDRFDSILLTACVVFAYCAMCGFLA